MERIGIEQAAGEIADHCSGKRPPHTPYFFHCWGGDIGKGGCDGLNVVEKYYHTQPHTRKRCGLHRGGMP